MRRAFNATAITWKEWVHNLTRHFLCFFCKFDTRAITCLLIDFLKFLRRILSWNLKIVLGSIYKKINATWKFFFGSNFPGGNFLDTGKGAIIRIPRLSKKKQKKKHYSYIKKKCNVNTNEKKTIKNDIFKISKWIWCTFINLMSFKTFQK